MVLFKRVMVFVFRSWVFRGKILLFSFYFFKDGVFGENLLNNMVCECGFFMFRVLG